MNIFRKTGFMFDVQNLKFILPDEDKIYEFLTNDINYYMKKFEVLATEYFKSKAVAKPNIGTVGVRVENNLLEIDMDKLNIDLNQLEDILQKYKLKKMGKGAIADDCRNNKIYIIFRINRINF